MLLQTLGGLALEGSTLRRPKLLLLLAYLALEGPMTRRELADLFWMSARDPRDSVSTALRRLREALGERLQLHGDKIAVELSCDAVDLLTALDSGAWDHGIGMYEGAFLQGLSFGLDEELEEWVYGTRDYLAARVREAHLVLAEHSLADNDRTVSAQHAEAVVTLPGAPPLEPHDLLRVYPVLRAASSPLAVTIQKEAEALGVDLPEVALHPTNIAALSTTNPVNANSNNFPQRLTSFVGREQEAGEIMAALSEPTCRLVTLHGEGGIGKTRLAVHMAERLASGFPDGVSFVRLETVASAEGVPHAILEALGLRAAENPLSDLTRQLKDKRMLLVLDNVEHLMAGAPIIADLLQSCPGIHILTTSRERLHLEEEWVFTLEGLPYPAFDASIADAKQYAAVDLFLQRAKKAQREFALTDDTLPHVLRVCQLVEGVPLALELAAVGLRVLPIEEISHELEVSLETLSTPHRNVPDRHQSMRAVFEHSWQLLTDQEQRALAKLAVFHGGFRREAASEIAGVTLPALARLSDKSLLRTSRYGRFDFHPLLHAYVREKLEENPKEAVEVRRAHGKYIFELFAQLDEQGARPEREQWDVRALDEERENLRAAWAWAAREQPILLKDCVVPMWRYFQSQSRFLEGLQLTHDAIAKLKAEEPDHQAALGNVLVLQSGCLWWLSRFEESRMQAERGLELLRPLNDQKGIEFGLTMLGGTAWYLGEFELAKQCFEGGYALAKELNRRVTQQIQNLAHVEWALGNYLRAEELYNEAAARNRREGKFDYLVANLCSLAWYHIHHGNLDQAETYAHEALDLSRKVGSRELPAQSVAARIALLRQDYARAQNLAEQTLRLCRERGNVDHQVEVLLTLAGLARHQKEPAAGLLHIHEALRLGERTRSPSITFQVLLELAQHYVALECPGKAVSLLTLSCRHPAAAAPIKDEARALLGVLRHHIPADLFQDAMEVGEALTPEHALEEGLAFSTSTV